MQPSFWKIPPYLQGVIAVLCLVGIGVRFLNLKNNSYWGDEFFSLLRLSGYTQTELLTQVFNGTLRQISELNVYQSAENSRTLWDTVRSLAIEDSQHPPLYYSLLRLWAQHFGDSITTIRSFSSFTSLFALPAIYWLSFELFQLPLAAWLSVGLISVSPLHFLTAQEVREYGLWTVAILVASALLLKSMRCKRRIDWITYTITSAIGLYTFPMSIFVMTSHALYVAKTESFRLSANAKAFLSSVIVAGIAFLPWALVMWQYRKQIVTTNLWSSYAMPLVERIGNYVFNLGLTFIAIPHAFSKFPQADIPLMLWLTVPIVTLATLWISCYAVYFVCVHAPKPARLFLISLMGVTFAAIFLPDLVTQARRSTAYRYLIPCYLGLHLAIAYLMAIKLNVASKRRLHFWRGMTLGLLGSAVVTGLVHLQVPGGLNHYREPEHAIIARAINSAPRPLLIGNAKRTPDRPPGTDGSLGVLFTLMHRLNPSTQVQLVVEPQVPVIPSGRDTFLYNPSDFLLESLRQNYDTTLVQPSLQGDLWKLVRR
ncbi:glycosyltransferase family 39 protein [Leptolyngbya sp. AN03gr2]|uniref:glycosyltransferase family 39 protein n=1 Tax=unclassified Leptolyngbya TaxID=2650499 RepID=UPI003D316B35